MVSASTMRESLLTPKGLRKLRGILFTTILTGKSRPLGFNALWRPADLESSQTAWPLKYAPRNHPEGLLGRFGPVS
jgi:hypothetical protein